MIEHLFGQLTDTQVKEINDEVPQTLSGEETADIIGRIEQLSALLAERSPAKVAFVIAIDSPGTGQRIVQATPGMARNLVGASTERQSGTEAIEELIERSYGPGTSSAITDD